MNYYKPRTNKAKNIRAYREWYWLRKGGKSYVDIANNWSSQENVESDNIGNDDNSILKGVKYYEKLLSL